ncbi:conserved exported hypothetical protein [Planktothrix serta PCC 8927]|uniref:Argininosuccinate lyase n=1 Tax=Planktothrix serta PCC 8927 TaxID=671068 RepID=A0A7Z9BWL7_9CYAN|nr:hypothetical protein [Planktothrix serta]VXD22831.1 conserved exported hypothetical protein [Planktothrix serta PCC 8927]
MTIRFLGEEPMIMSQLGINKFVSILLLSATIFAPGISLTASKAIAQSKSSTFTMSNGSKQVITEFYASPPSTSDWEEDILGTDVLSPGESVNITINDGRRDCLYDFRVVYEDGHEVIVTKQEVCDGSEYTFE